MLLCGVSVGRDVGFVGETSIGISFGDVGAVAALGVCLMGCELS